MLGPPQPQAGSDIEDFAPHARGPYFVSPLAAAVSGAGPQRKVTCPSVSETPQPGAGESRAALPGLGSGVAADAPMPPELDSRHLLRRLLGLAVLIALVALAVTALPGLGTLRARFSRADGLLLAAVGLLKLCSCLSNVVAFRDVFCPTMSWRFSYELG